MGCPVPRKAEREKKGARGEWVQGLESQFPSYCVSWKLMAFLNLDSLRHPGVLITNYDLGLQLGERVTATCNPKHLYWENLSAVALVPTLLLTSTPLPLSMRVSFKSYV